MGHNLTDWTRGSIMTDKWGKETWYNCDACICKELHIYNCKEGSHITDEKYTEVYTSTNIQAFEDEQLLLRHQRNTI